MTRSSRRAPRVLAMSVLLAGCAGNAGNAAEPETPHRDVPPPVTPAPAPATAPKERAIAPPSAPSASEAERPSTKPNEAVESPSTPESPSTSDVSLAVNLALVRKHPVLARVAPILTAGLNELAGTPVPLDPLRDVEWFSLFGPSLVPTNRDEVLAHYNVTDDVVSKAVGALVRSYDKGGPYDAGVAGVKASLGYADHGQRVFMQLQPRLLVVVPPASAHDAALSLRKQPPAGPASAEALRLVLRKPAQQLPSRFRTPSLIEVRLWITARAADGSADLYGEGECGTAEGATDTRTHLTDVIRRANSGLVRLMTRGILSGAVVETDGSKATLRVHATAEQLHAIVDLVASVQGVSLPVSPPAGPSAASPPK